MKVVASRARCDVDRAGGSQLRREVQTGLAELEFLDSALGNVNGGRAEYLVGNVNAVHFDSSGAAETSAEGDGREPVLAVTEVRAVLDLDARFQLCKVQEIAAIDGKVLNLLRIQHTLHGGLFGVHPQFGALDFDYPSLRPDLQVHIYRGGIANQHAQ